MLCLVPPVEGQRSVGEGLGLKERWKSEDENDGLTDARTDIAFRHHKSPCCCHIDVASAAAIAELWKRSISPSCTDPIGRCLRMDWKGMPATAAELST